MAKTTSANRRKLGHCCDVGMGVNVPVVPSREERCPAAGEGAAAADTKSPGGRNGIPERQEQYPREEGAVDRGEARQGPEARHPGADESVGDVRSRRRGEP